MRILIIDDNIELTKLIKKSLESFGFLVDLANNGEEGEIKSFITVYDCILLDLSLPDKDGIDILNFLRQSNICTPVIILTARTQAEEKALGLDQGADDYIEKPFQLIELRARIHAVIRRYHGRSSPIIDLGVLAIHPSSRKAYIDQQPFSLSSKEFDILEYLAERYPSIVSAEEIIEHVYDENFDPFSSVLRVHLANLRKKIKYVSNRNILKTERGKGYYLCLD
ncbi:response regulator transcription factor [Enterococcus faecium]|uniref:response regulator transcription factor n=1 Tax=Enterococcus faecium TaxID=1352 RepID=UPI003978BCE8